MPAVPSSGLAVVEPEFFFGALKAFLDGPAQASRAGQFGEAATRRRKDQVVCAFLRISAAASDQQPAFETPSNVQGSAMRAQS